MGNEISVDLRLRLDKLKQDAQKAGQDVQSGLASSIKGLRSDAEIAEENRVRREKIARARRNAALDAADAAKDAARAAAAVRTAAVSAQNDLDKAVEQAARRNRARRLIRQRADEKAQRGFGQLQGPDLGGHGRAKAADEKQKDKASFRRDMMFAALPVANPMSLLGNFASARQSYKAFSSTKTGGDSLAKINAVIERLSQSFNRVVGGRAGGNVLSKISGGVGPAAAAALVTGAAIAVGLALRGLQKVMQESMQAIDRARQLYAKQLQSGGQAQNFVVRQAVLAEVLGVSEDQVMQYGNAIGQLNGKLTTAINTLNETQRTLAATSLNSKVLGENLRAMWAKVAEAIAPALNRLYSFISAMVKLFILSGLATLVGSVIGAVVTVFTQLVAIASIIPAAIMTVMTAIVDGFRWVMAKIHNLLADSWLGKKAGMKHEDTPGFGKTKEALGSLKEVLAAAFATPGSYNEKAAAVPTSVSRMPASTWEKMGLVIGGGSHSDHAKKTADNTSKMVTLLGKMVGNAQPRTGGPQFASAFPQP